MVMRFFWCCHIFKINKKYAALLKRTLKNLRQFFQPPNGHAKHGALETSQLRTEHAPSKSYHCGVDHSTAQTNIISLSHVSAGLAGCVSS